MGRHLSPRSNDTGQRIPWAPKLDRNCESKHWFPCGAVGRSVVGVRSRDYQIFWDG